MARVGANGVEAGIRSIDNIAEAGLRGVDNAASGVMRGLGDATSGVLRNLDGVAREAGRGLRNVGEAAARWGNETGQAVAKNVDGIAASAGRTLNNTDSISKNADEMRNLGLTFRNCSFSGDTIVWTTGGAKPIAEVAPGDFVLAFDEAKDRTAYFPVTEVYAHVDAHIRLVEVGDDRLTTTANHPFYHKSKGWIPAGELVAGDLVRNRNGAHSAVASVSTLVDRRVMYNLEVSVAHNYHVGAGGWLVHNECWVSKGGLVYTDIGVPGKDRLDHVWAHLGPVPGKTNHTIFNVKSQSDLILLLDEAWASTRKFPRGVPTGDITRWVVPMNRVVGTKGETAIFMVIRDGNEVITAYPYPAPRPMLKPM